MNDLAQPIERVVKLTKPQVEALKKLGITNPSQVLLHFPFRYLDFSKTQTLDSLTPGENVSVKVVIKSISSRFSFRGRMSLAEALLADKTGNIKAIWFNQGYLAKTLKKGDELFLAGTPEIYKNLLQFINPIYEKVSDFPIHTSRLVPVYHLKSGIYPKTFRNLVKTCLIFRQHLPENLPGDLRKKNGLPDIADTVLYSHFPNSLKEVETAKRRLAYEEILINQLAAQKTKLELGGRAAWPIVFNQELAKNFLSRLNFELTTDQKKAAWEIIKDLGKTSPMNRLLNGDVGSGKTLVALMAAAQVVAQGFQVVFLAPTEILAKQHFETAKAIFLRPNRLNPNLRCVLVTQNHSLIDDEQIKKSGLRQEIGDGTPGIYFGTHALLQKTVKFKNLNLVVIDEQHRWGVEQRAQLIHSQNKVPHLLSLSATPIPRTLKLAFFGELNVSQIVNKPKNRKPIITKLVDPQHRTAAYEFIKKQLLAGRQAFVITPLIEESDSLGIRAAKAEAEALKKIFPGFKIGLLHGQMEAMTKTKAMADFSANHTQILVATSVIEVGIDIPNASVMLIESAERFGLSQLHQFRGRVGRAEHQSYCFLFANNITLDGQKRLTAFCKTENGFELAELDLKHRGFGELYGQAQSGWNFKYFDPTYLTLAEPARQDAKDLLEIDPNLDTHPGLKALIQNKIIHFE